MEDYSAPPLASSLIESMRDIGYSFKTAIADIIDNSITAESSRVDVFCDADRQQPVIAILDNEPRNTPRCYAAGKSKPFGLSGRWRLG